MILTVWSPSNSIRITWEYVRTADSQALTGPTGSEMLSLLNASGDSEACTRSCKPLITHPLSKFKRTPSIKYLGTYVSSEKGLIPNFPTVKSLQKESP